MHQKDIIDVLNKLIETSKDGQNGFQSCAEHAKSSGLREVLLARSAECQSAMAELQVLVSECGGKPDDGGTMSGAIHRGWVTVRGTLAGFTDVGLLEECERGEDVAKARYLKAMQQPLPDAIRSIVERQYQGVLRNHDLIKTMRDQCRAAA